jgi:glyoxylase-like metal-dependent hydrolase (beta-lactamase superfamily II)
MANPPSTARHDAALAYPWGDTLPAPGQVLELAPGLLWLRMPLPFALDHINLWLLRDEDEQGRAGWAAVDCGIDNPPTRAAWEQVLAHEALQGLPLLRVIVTHMHPDHIGLAHWLCARFSGPGRECRLWISATDWNAARVASQAGTGFGGDEAAAFFALHGLSDPASLDQVRARSGYYASLVPQVPRRYRRLLDGQTVAVGTRRWRCIAGYGHAPEHIALFDAAARVLISGDMVLPRISTNVSVIDLEPEADPLPLFLRSLDAMRPLPADTLVLPSHGKPFRGLHTRIGQLHAHHAERLADVLQACAETPRSAAELLPVLFKRTLDLHQTTFAMGESIAHVHALAGQGLLQPVDGAEGVRRWRATGPQGPAAA